MAQLKEETSVELTSGKKANLAQIKAHGLLLAGQKLVKEECYESGIDQLSDALALMVENFGELDSRTSIYYLEYGKALLAQGDVLTNMLSSAQENDQDKVGQSDEKEPLPIEEDMKTTIPEAPTQNISQPKNDVHDIKQLDKKDVLPQQGEASTNIIPKGPSGDTLHSNTKVCNPPNNPIPPQEEPPKAASDTAAENRELAWQLFETARITVANDEKMEDKEKSLQLGEVHCLLGEVALGGGDFDRGYGEFSTSIKLLGKALRISDPKIGKVQQLAGLCAVQGRQLEAAQFHYTAAAENHNMHLEELLVAAGVMKARDPNEPESEDIEFVDRKYIDLLKEKVGEESPIFKKCVDIFDIVNDLIDRVEELMEEEEQKKAEVANVMKLLAEKMKSGEFPGLTAAKDEVANNKAKNSLVTEQVGFDSSQQPGSAQIKELGTFGGTRRKVKRVAPLGLKVDNTEVVTKKARTL